MEHEYRRAGALHLFAAFDTRSGRVYGRPTRRKRQVEYLALLEELAAFRKPALLAALRSGAPGTPIQDIRFRIGAVGPVAEGPASAPASVTPGRPEPPEPRPAPPRRARPKSGRGPARL